MPKNKNWFSLSNIFTYILILFAVAMLLFPNFKALVIQGLMKVGLFQPSIPAKVDDKANLSANRTSVVFTNSSGNVIDTKDLEGKVVFINFWATWCPPCIAEMPTVSQLYTKYKNNPNVIFILADADGDLPKANTFMKNKGFDLPVYSFQNNPPSAWYEGSLPTTVVLDKKGNVAFRHTGAADYSSNRFANYIEELLKQ